MTRNRRLASLGYLLLWPTLRVASALVPFQKFLFARNDVCLRPQLFYTNDNQEFTLRNVPGEGDCVFLATALATATSMGMTGNAALLRAIAGETRRIVAEVLSAPTGNLYIESHRVVPAAKLLASAARAENMTTDAYLEAIRDGSLQGGGPELTVLSNVLRRPISIYELDEPAIAEALIHDESVALPIRYRIRLAGRFGERFQDPCLSIPNSAVLSGLQAGAYSWHVHVLIVDAGGGDKHACALLPQVIPNKLDDRME